MSTYIEEVDSVDRIRSAEFIKLTVIGTNTNAIYTFSTSYKKETIGGVEYSPMGGLIAIGNQQRDLAVTAYDTSISLAGVDPANISLVLNTNIRGSEIEIHRGFYSDGGLITGMYPRFTGIVTSYTISEQREDQIDSFSVVINCSSYKSILENNIGGRRTSPDIWKALYAGTDTSMDNVVNLNGAYFDFGVPVK
jgi:hypothetical protein